MELIIEPLVMNSQRDADGIYRFRSGDGKALMDLDPDKKQMILKWHDQTTPGGYNLAAVSFFRGYTLFVVPIAEREVTTDVEDQFLVHMAIAFELVKQTVQPDGAVVH